LERLFFEQFESPLINLFRFNNEHSRLIGLHEKNVQLRAWTNDT